MKEKPWILKNIVPLTTYIFVILAVFVLKIFLPWQYVISISAALMLLIPILLKSDGSYLRWDLKGIILGFAVSAVLLAGYVGVIALYGHYTSKSLIFNYPSYSLLLTHLLLVALPEEVFFRGYLQSKIGNTIKGIIIVSLLFAVGHFITLCLGGGHNLAICSQAILTFFPSLVMGYLFMVSRTLWASIIFHFFANIVHIAIGLS